MSAGSSVRATAVPADSTRRRPRADSLGATLLVLAGLAGVLQYLLPAFPVASLTNTAASGRLVTQTFAPFVADVTEPSSVIRLAVLAAAVGGAALGLLGLCSLLPVNHRPLGTVSLVLSLVIAAGAAGLYYRGEAVLGASSDALLSVARPGWWLVVAAASLGFLGAIRQLAR